MPQTKKNILDSIFIILTRFGRSDDSRFDSDWISYKIDQIRAELIIKQFAVTNTIDYAWLSNVSLLPFHRINLAEDISITSCDCDISKATIPQTITLQSKYGNLDLGIYSLISPCGKTTYYPSRVSQFRYVPEGHTNKLFGHYARINTTIYVDRLVENLKFIGILLSPEEGYLINSAPVLSGSIQLGVVYWVTQGQVIYNQTVYQPGTTFVGASNAGAVIPTFQGSGIVHLYSQIAAYRDVDPYPAGGEMIRMIELEILTKEFGLEKQQVADVRNDSKDDVSKAE